MSLRFSENMLRLDGLGHRVILNRECHIAAEQIERVEFAVFVELSHLADVPDRPHPLDALRLSTVPGIEQLRFNIAVLK